MFFLVQNTGGDLSYHCRGAHISLKSGLFLHFLYRKKGLIMHLGARTVTSRCVRMFIVMHLSESMMHSVR